MSMDSEERVTVELTTDEAYAAQQALRRGINSYEVSAVSTAYKSAADKLRAALDQDGAER